MEYVLIRYPEARAVFVDGEKRGVTNIILRTNRGTHSFDLGEPFDYHPRSQEISVEGTSSINPLEVTFEKA